jgi:hypothetical protein
MWPNMTQDENLIFQSYFSFCLLAELMRDKRLVRSEFFNSLAFDNKAAKIAIEKLGVDNQGCLLMCLYSLLVIPKQLLESKYPREFLKINGKIARYSTSTISTYKGEPPYDYVRHIRNAVSHARVVFNPGQTVEFQDERGPGEKFAVTMPLTALPRLLEDLQAIHMTYIKDRENGTVP